MDSFLKNRFTATTLLILGANPLFVVTFFGPLIFNILLKLHLLLPFLPPPGRFVYDFVGQILAIIFVILSLTLCLTNLERVGYKKIDVLRLFIPFYGVYFAIQLASKFTMSSEELEQGSTKPSPGGMTF